MAACCRRCEERLWQFSAVAAALPRALPDVPVPASLCGRIMARVVQEGQPSIVRRREKRHRPWPRGRSWAGGPVAAGRSDGWIVWSPSRRQGFLVIHYLAPPPPGRQYQLWVIADQARSAGVFDVDSLGHTALVVNGDVMRPDLFAVTIEAAGGALIPTGPVVMRSAGQAG